LRTNNDIRIVQARNCWHLQDVNRLIFTSGIGEGNFKRLPPGFVVAKLNNAVIGCARIEMQPGFAVLESVVVEHSYKHKGIGSELIRNRLKYAVRQGRHTIALCSMYYHFNFYKRRGFHTIPRAKLPDNIRAYPQFVSPRYTKCAVMIGEFVLRDEPVEWFEGRFVL